MLSEFTHNIFSIFTSLAVNFEVSNVFWSKVYTLTKIMDKNINEDFFSIHNLLTEAFGIDYFANLVLV